MTATISAVDELNNYGGLPSPEESRLIGEDIWHHEAHNSTALEGNTLVLREVRTLLDENRPIGAKDLKDYMEVLGYGEAARWVYSQARVPDRKSAGELISVTEIRNVHRLTMRRVWEVAPHPNRSTRAEPGSSAPGVSTGDHLQDRPQSATCHTGGICVVTPQLRAAE